MTFSVLYSSNIVCITPPPLFDATLSEKSGTSFSPFYFRGIKASAVERANLMTMLRSAVKMGSVTTVHEMIKTEFDILSKGPNCVRASGSELSLENVFATFLEKKFCVSPRNTPCPNFIFLMSNNYKEACAYSNFGCFSVLSVISRWIKTQSKSKDKKLY